MIDKDGRPTAHRSQVAQAPDAARGRGQPQEELNMAEFFGVLLLVALVAGFLLGCAGGRRDR
jgi:hypothetical protein